MKRFQFLRNHFLAGLFVIIPLAVIVWILSIVMGALWKIRSFFPQSWHPENFLGEGMSALLLDGVLTLVIAVLLGVGISILGWASKQYLGTKILEWVAEIIQRIPVIRSIYSALDQLLRTLAAGGSQQFNRVVYIEYPRKGLWSLAFVTGPAQGPGAPEGHLNVYVPTTPNPTSGFHLLVPEKDVRESHLRVEEAFKTLLSLGIAQSHDVKAGDRSHVD